MISALWIWAAGGGLAVLGGVYVLARRHQARADAVRQLEATAAAREARRAADEAVARRAPADNRERLGRWSAGS